MRVVATAALVLMLCAVVAYAFAPGTVSYQGVLRCDEGDIVPDHSHGSEAAAPRVVLR